MDIEKINKIVKTDIKEGLKQIYPEVFEDNKINFEKLKSLLSGEIIEKEDDRFYFNWAGKSTLYKLIQSPAYGTLKPDKEKSIDFDNTENIVIVGENLETLKLLLKPYFGKVKMIYIDPPYNTGKDFIYRDNFKEPLKDYLEKTGQIDSEGKKLATNPETNGRYHSDWLNFMYPRLFLARNLLRNDGVIFVSIDDHEVHHLRMIMDEIFGEENFVNLISVKVRESAGESGGGEDKRLKKHIDYLLMYVKNRNVYLLPKTYASSLLKYELSLKESINDSFVYGDVMLKLQGKEYKKTIKDGKGNDIKIYTYQDFDRLTVKQLAKQEKLGIYEVYKKYFDKIYTSYNARTSIRDRVKEALPNFDGLIEIEYTPKSGKYKGKLISKFFIGKTKRLIAWLKEISEKNGKEEIILKSEIGTLWTDISWATLASEGEIKFNDGKKPIEFIKRMLQLAKVESNDLVLDFFAGSGTTGQAVWDLNKEDGGNRKFILVQLDEEVQDEEIKKEFPTVADICIERLKRVSEKYRQENNQQLFNKNHDLGFKVFRLARSNFNFKDEFEVEKGKDVEELKKKYLEWLGMFVDQPLVSGWKKIDVVYEVMLKEGLSLNSKIEQVKIKENDFYYVNDTEQGLDFYINLENQISTETIEEIRTSKYKGKMFVFLDNALTDSDKINLSAFVRLKVI